MRKSTHNGKSEAQRTEDAVPREKEKRKSKHRRKIPKAVKVTVWAKYIGANKAEGKCYVCKKTIHITDFDVGHNKAVARGGSDTITNLRPICRTCNLSMGTMPIEIFKRKHFPKTPNDKQFLMKDRRREVLIKRALINELSIIRKTLSEGVKKEKPQEAPRIPDERFPLITEAYDSVRIELVSFLKPDSLSIVQRTYEEIRKMNLGGRGHIIIPPNTHIFQFTDFNKLIALVDDSVARLM